jgi:hypothetical protein
MAHFSIDSKVLATTSPSAQLYELMGDFNNFKHLLPEDKIEDFTCTADACSFGIRGVTTLNIRIKEKEAPNRITFETTGLAKFVFTLHILFAQNPDTCQVKLDGDLNPFIKMMAEKPLTELVNTMATKLSTLQLS